MTPTLWRDGRAQVHNQRSKALYAIHPCTRNQETTVISQQNERVENEHIPT